MLWGWGWWVGSPFLKLSWKGSLLVQQAPFRIFPLMLEVPSVLSPFLRKIHLGTNKSSSYIDMVPLFNDRVWTICTEQTVLVFDPDLLPMFENVVLLRTMGLHVFLSQQFLKIIMTTIAMTTTSFHIYTLRDKPNLAQSVGCLGECSLWVWKECVFCCFWKK